MMTKGNHLLPLQQAHTTGATSNENVNSYVHTNMEVLEPSIATKHSPIRSYVNTQPGAQLQLDYVD